MNKETRLPTKDEIQELAAYLPLLYAEGFEPVKQWHGGVNKDGLYTLPWPEYDPLVEEFFRRAAGECWLDYNYRPEDAAEKIKHPEYIRTASLSQVKSMLTYCVRGERFSDGHREEMIQNGTIRRLLERLAVLGSEISGQNEGS